MDIDRAAIAKNLNAAADELAKSDGMCLGRGISDALAKDKYPEVLAATQCVIAGPVLFHNDLTALIRHIANIVKPRKEKHNEQV